MSTLDDLRATVTSLEVQIQKLVSQKQQAELELREAERASAQQALSRILEEIKALHIPAEELAKSLGLQTKAPQKKPSAVKNAGAPKYRSSIDPSLTWTGKGRKPAWINLFLENGGNLEDWTIRN